MGGWVDDWMTYQGVQGLVIMQENHLLVRPVTALHELLRELRELANHLGTVTHAVFGLGLDP